MATKAEKRKEPLSVRRRKALLAVLLEETARGPVAGEPCELANRLEICHIRSGYWLVMLLIEHDWALRRAGLRWRLTSEPASRWSAEDIYTLYIWRSGQEAQVTGLLRRGQSVEPPDWALLEIAHSRKVHPATRIYAERLLRRMGWR